MTVREYIGARYVPLFMGAWSSENTYEPLSIVSYQGNSYTSRQAVPTGIEITNETYWAVTGNYNAQVEAYRQEVRELETNIDGLSDRIDANTADIAANTANISSNTEAITAETTSRQQSDNALNSRITIVENTISGLSLNENTNLVCIGDSFLEHVTPSWGQIIASLIGTDDYHKFAISGSGYSSNTKFSQIVENAHTSMGDEANNVDALIIGGGINDARNNKTYSQVYNDAINCFTLAHTYFPNAVIYVFSMLLGNRGYGNVVRRCDKAIADAAKYVGRTTANCDIRIYGGCWSWLYDTANAVDSDHIHPVAIGQQLIAYSMINAMRGADSTVRSADTPILDIGGSTIGTATRNGEFITINMSGTPITTAVVGGKNVAFFIDQRYYADGIAAPVYDGEQNGNVLMTDATLSNGGDYIFAYTRTNKASWFSVTAPINDDYFILNN